MIFKNPEISMYIVLILSNRPQSFQNSRGSETGFSDFHKMTLTVMKKYCQKHKLRIITC